MPSITWTACLPACSGKNDMMRFYEKASETSRPVVVFGASVTGKIVLDLLDIMGMRPVCFCDNDPRKQLQPFHGYDVLSFERVQADYADALVIVAADRYYKEIKNQLSRGGFNDTYRDSDLVQCIDFRKAPPSKVDKVIWHLAKQGKLAELGRVSPGELHLPRLNVVITSRCTLRCKDCSSLIPFYKERTDFDTGKIVDSLDRIFACVDWIYHVELLGGELFLSPDVPLIMNHLLDKGKILHIDVITNGTILPSTRVLESFKHNRVSVVIDDYGRLSGQKDALSETLMGLGIDFRINRHWAWADLGGFAMRKRSGQALKNLFAACNFNSCAELLDGRLHRCPRSSHGTKTGLVPEYPGDFLEISDSARDTDDLKEKLRRFFYDKEFIQACDHCDGNTENSLVLIPAEQKRAR